jgi:acyl-coenzyme A synthetase/AMP-(fatty) acid ligase
MKMLQRKAETLWGLVTGYGDLRSRCIADAGARVELADLVPNQERRAATDALRNRSVLLHTNDQLGTALALVALDGIARRLVICPAKFPPEFLASVMRTAEVDAVVSDQAKVFDGFAEIQGGVHRPEVLAPPDANADRTETEWILFTSGTTGVPKQVVHTLRTLVGPVDRVRSLGANSVWSTFYDIRRYGGLQILLRALAAGGSMVLSNSSEMPAEFVRRLAGEGVTHISGTPSHWRLALMSGTQNLISPRYVRMSGEVADAAVIAALRAAYPDARVSHAFASTEAGVVFDVDDGSAGFPARFIDPGSSSDVTLRVEDGSLRVRSTRVAHRYLGDGMPPLVDADGFADTGDMVVLRGDRYHFAGRREGVINIGGQKVHPEEIEAVINQHPNVRMSLVKARPSPIVGSIVVAEVVPRSPTPASFNERDFRHVDGLAADVLQLCRETLAPFKVPASVRIVPSLNISAAGKLVRSHA